MRAWRGRVGVQIWLTAITLLAVFVVTGCGGDDSGGGESSEDGDLQTVKATSLPILDDAPYFWALDTGLFEKHGLEVEDQTSAGGAADLPAMVSGDLDLVYSNTVSALLAKEEGLPIKIVTGTNENLPESKSRDDFVAIVTGPDSGITSPEQLEGKKMATNTLNNIGHLFERAWLESEGVDPDQVEFLEVPFPEQPVALERGRVDATMIGPPFLQQLKAQGAKVLGYPYRVLPRVLVASYIATDEFVQENPEAAEAFRSALAEANEQVEDPANRERLLEILEERTKVDKETIAKATLPLFTTEVDPGVLKDTADLMVRYGMMESVPDIEQLIFEPGQ